MLCRLLVNIDFGPRGASLTAIAMAQERTRALSQARQLFAHNLPIELNPTLPYGMRTVCN